jgi:von Willebrand factor type A domain
VPVELTNPLWLLALLAVVPVVVVWRRWPTAFSRRQRQAALGVRLGLVAAIVLALAGPELSYHASSQTLVVAADRSASTAQAQYQETPAVQALASALPAQDQLGVVSFGQDALVEDPPAHDPEFQGFATSPGANFTDLESALQLAGSMAAPGTRRHVVLITDGRQNVGDAVGEARVLRSEGVRVDVLPLRVPVGPDVRVDSVQVPSTVLPGSRAQATAVLVSNETTTARVEWSLDNTQVVMDTVVRVKPGVTEVRVLLPPAHPGFHQVNIEIAPARDTVPGNDFGEGLFQVLGAQEVLVVAGSPGAGTNVAAALRAAGIDATVVSPAEVPVSVPGIARWQSVALVNVSAAQLGYQRMEALATAARDLGVGLAAFGGTNTYGPGGLAGTPLEQALPIEMKVANPQAKPPVAVMLVLESVESPAGDLVLRSAARQLVANLSPEDLVGVANGESGVVLPLQPVGNGQKVEKDIMDIPSFGDPPSYVPYIQDAASALGGHAGDSKYIVVLGDGDADDPLPTPSFMAGIVHQGITVSTVGADVHGVPQFMANMAAIAAEGDGRFYDSESASQLPSIFLDETQAQLQPWVVQERFHVAAGVPSPALDGIDPSSLPPLDGYVAATPKPSAQVVLSGPAGDPILAQWQYGLGTALAWTSDTQGRWTAELLGSPLAGRLFAGIVAATLPLAASPALSVSTQLEGDQAHLVAEAATAPADASAVAHVVGPDGQGSDVPLAETAPGRFEADVPTPEVGAYLMRVEVSAAGRLLDAATTGVAIAYSPELRFIGTDLPFLRQVAEAGGGVVLSAAGEALSEPVPPVNVTQSLAEWLLVLAVVLLPLDVALRRLVIGRKKPVLRAEGTAREVSAKGRGSRRAKSKDDGKPPTEPPAPLAVEEAETVLATKLLERLRR